MDMFWLRAMRPDSPFRARVGCMDHFFMNVMATEFKFGTWKIDVSHMEKFNGNNPLTSATGKRWWYDIDNLYGVVNINNNHRVAVDINFSKEKIFVYDSIPTLMNDTKLVEQLQFIRKIIPKILNIMVDKKDRRPHKMMFSLIRVNKNVPINKNPGDCGVYAIKYIECLALGWRFDGLDNSNIMTLQRRLAAELYDEIPHASNASAM